MKKIIIITILSLVACNLCAGDFSGPKTTKKQEFQPNLREAFNTSTEYADFLRHLLASARRTSKNPAPLEAPTQKKQKPNVTNKVPQNAHPSFVVNPQKPQPLPDYESGLIEFDLDETKPQTPLKRKPKIYAPYQSVMHIPINDSESKPLKLDMQKSIFTLSLTPYKTTKLYGPGKDGIMRIPINDAESKPLEPNIQKSMPTLSPERKPESTTKTQFKIAEMYVPGKDGIILKEETSLIPQKNTKPLRVQQSVWRIQNTVPVFPKSKFDLELEELMQETQKTITQNPGTIYLEPVSHKKRKRPEATEILPFPQELNFIDQELDLIHREENAEQIPLSPIQHQQEHEKLNLSENDSQEKLSVSDFLNSSY